MDVVQLASNFLLGLSRMADFFGGVEKFFDGVRWFFPGELIFEDLSSGSSDS